MMPDIWTSILFSVMIWMLGGLVIYQALGRKKEGSKLWKIYNEVSRELGLIEKEESTMGYGLPDIVGKIKGRRVFIHPIVGKGAGGLAKTAFAVEHKIRLDKKVMISSTQISPLLLGKLRYPINMNNLSGYSPNYLVTSQAKTNQNIMNKLFTTNISNSFNSMASRDPKKFLSLILESGIAIFYTLGWEEEKELLKNTLLTLVELVEQMEKNAPILDPNIDNRLFKYTTKKTYSKTIDVAMSIFITILGIIILGIIIITFSDIQSAVLLLNIGIVVILMGATRVYAATKMKG